MLDQTVRSAIGKVLDDALSPVAVVSVSFAEGQDHDANDVIFITISLPPGTGPLPASNYMDAMTAVSRTLLHANDQRMPLFRTVREGEPEPIDDGPGRAS